MLKFLARFPRFNGFALGLLQGIPQGIVLPDQEQWVLSALSVFDQNLLFVIGLGLFVPLAFFYLVVAIRGAKRSKLWIVCNRYVNLYEMMFWGCLSFAAAGFYALDRAGADVGYGLCVSIASNGVGFLAAGILETRLQNKNLQTEM